VPKGKRKFEGGLTVREESGLRQDWRSSECNNSLSDSGARGKLRRVGTTFPFVIQF
jgi:hypothetical protein